VKLTVSGSRISSPPPHVVSLVGHGYPRTLQIGERKTLSLMARFSDGSERELREGVEWQSSDATVLKASATGELEALKDGRATVTASYQDFESAPVPIEVRGKGTQPPTTLRVKPAPRTAPAEVIVPRQPPSTKQWVEAPAAPIATPQTEPPRNLARHEPPSVKKAPEAPDAPLPDARKVISDYIRGEQQRRSKSGR
jgi:hypothetical protein